MNPYTLACASRANALFPPRLAEYDADVAYQLDLFLRVNQININDWSSLFNEVQLWHPRTEPTQPNEDIYAPWLVGPRRSTLLSQALLNLQSAVKAAKAKAQGMTDVARIYNWLADLPSTPAAALSLQPMPPIEESDPNDDVQFATDDNVHPHGWQCSTYPNQVPQANSLTRPAQYPPLQPETETRFVIPRLYGTLEHPPGILMPRILMPRAKPLDPEERLRRIRSAYFEEPESKVPPQVPFQRQ
ncbi:hypothetical protein IQ07DRAFT_677092 [Pyrenochaeta sp. DS3sAY3a]|nr:hypothetical protein IQ07DRAFT_677092 [Pyrenochaeta sp. DS3sAY3a]